MLLPATQMNEKHLCIHRTKAGHSLRFDGRKMTAFLTANEFEYM